MSDFVWAPGSRDCGIRTKPVAGMVWHWTGGGDDPERVVHTLKERGLSIHFVIGYDGKILRCADPATTVCFHAGKTANARFIGVEICNRGIGSQSAKNPRAHVPASAHGRKFTALDFSPAQYESILLLADEMSARFAIPKVTAASNTVIDVAAFSGHMEHINVSKKKIDCGGLVMAKLRVHGYA
jgi:N-acetyl-anhydromuramyl-L-alanine amidase AmpD